MSDPESTHPTILNLLMYVGINIFLSEGEKVSLSGTVLLYIVYVLCTGGGDICTDIEFAVAEILL